MKIAILALALLLGGCGGKSSRTPVRIAIVGAGAQTIYMPIALAQALGYYEQEGLDVSFENLPSSAKTMQALVGGSVDVAAFAYIQTIQMAAEGQRMRSFFVSNQRASYAVVVSPTAKKKIEKLEDLSGTVLGVPSPGSAAHLWMNYYLATHGVPQAEISAVAVGLGGAAVAAAESGRVDVSSLGGGDHIRLLRRNPGMRVLVDGSTAESMRETFGGDLWASGTLSARQEWLDRNPETARRLARAMRQSLEWIASHTPEEIHARLPESARSEDTASDIAVIAWGRPAYSKDGSMPKGAPEAMKRFLEATVPAMRSANVDLAATWTNEYLPPSK